MSYKESEVKIVNHLTKIYDGAEIIFIPDKDIDINNIQEVITSITLDVVYLKKNINLDNKIVKEGNQIKVVFDKFPLEKENESDLMNIATLNFVFNDKNKKPIMEKKLIVQIFREKTDIFKNII
jgi:hypothetical protein